MTELEEKINWIIEQIQKMQREIAELKKKADAISPSGRLGA